VPVGVTDHGAVGGLEQDEGAVAAH
jgi:hypothetical protein